MNNAVFGKTMQNVRKRENKLITTERKRNYVVKSFSQEIYQLQKSKKKDILKNKPLHLELSIQEENKTFRYEHVKPRQGEKVKLSYMDTDFNVYIKTADIYKDIAKEVQTRFDSNNELHKRLPKSQN